MRSIRGKALDLAVISKFIDHGCNLCGPHKSNGLGFGNLLKFRLFSDGQFRKGGRTDSDYDDDKFGGRNGRKFGGPQSFGGPGPNPGRPVRGERQRSNLGGQNGPQDRDYRRQGRRDDGFGKPFSRDGGGGRAGVKLGDESLGFENDEGSRGNEGRTSYQPSIRELLNAPAKGEGSSGKEGSDFLDKFKLGSDGKEESRSNEADSTTPAEEDKMEAPEEADEIFKKMKQTGLIPNAVAMLDGLCQDGLVQEAMKLFGMMREKGSMPEVVVYTAVVEGFCKAQKLDDAKRIFRKMQNNGIVPNAFCFTVLIKGLCKGNKLDDAVEFCVEMLEAGCSPNVPTFTGLVHEICKEKGVEEAKHVIGTLKQKGFILDEKAVRLHLDKSGPTSSLVWEAIFGPKKSTQRAI